jgi:hypothetical protein
MTPEVPRASRRAGDDDASRHLFSSTPIVKPRRTVSANLEACHDRTCR